MKIGHDGIIVRPYSYFLIAGVPDWAMVTNNEDAFDRLVAKDPAILQYVHLIVSDDLTWQRWKDKMIAAQN